MNMTSGAPGQITEAIVYTLINSLWLGIIFALIAGCIVATTRKTDSRVRYNFLLFILAAFLLGLTACFFYTWFAKPLAGDASPLSAGATDPERFVKIIHEHAPDIFRIWLIIIVIQLARLSFNLYRLDRLSKSGVINPGSVWAEKLAGFIGALGIERKVELKVSALVSSPLVIGFLKPVILLPAGLINELSPGEIELILLHELAHIKRTDFLVNIIIRLIRCLLFFNPAIWWLCKLIEEEREHCCDDIAVQICGDKVNYVRTLVNFAENHARLPVFAMAFTGGMVGRVERIVTGRHRPLARIEMICLGIILALGVWLTLTHKSQDIISLAKPSVQNQRSGKPPDPAGREAKMKAEAERSALKKTQPHSP
jgi:beta-lactamase regulating signal transducer with metallopeptidase domain